MKKNIKIICQNTFFVFLSILFLLSNEHLSAQNKELTNIYIQSKNNWEKYKLENKNTYSFETTFSSGEGMFTINRIIKVKNNKIVSVKQTYKNDQTNKEETIELSKSQIKEYKLMTLDEFYIFAEKEVLSKDTKNFDLYMEVDKKGILANCGYYPKECQDDCFEGLTIIDVKW